LTTDLHAVSRLDDNGRATVLPQDLSNWQTAAVTGPAYADGRHLGQDDHRGGQPLTPAVLGAG
jgi:hypothetical protein